MKKTYFEEERERLCREIGHSFESVLANINKLNRNLEGAITVGNEFSSVEALWSQFENVMAKNAEGGEKEGQAAEPAAEPATEHAGQEERDGSGEETNVDNGKHCAAKS